MSMPMEALPKGVVDMSIGTPSCLEGTARIDEDHIAKLWKGLFSRFQNVVSHKAAS